MTLQTKLVFTLGPASQGRVRELVAAGMDVARINFSHGDFEAHAAAAAEVRQAAAEAGREIAILADLPGPKVRLGPLAGGTVELSTGSRFLLYPGNKVGDVTGAATTHDGLTHDLQAGDRVLLSDGAAELRVLETGDVLVTEVVRGGSIRSGAGVNVPSERLSLPAISARDQEALSMAIRMGVDYAAQSFVRSPEDLIRLRSLAGEADLQIIAKIETRPAVEHAERIMRTADGVMIARGDLGVELPFPDIPVIQKDLIRQAHNAGVPSIVATQMLESMTNAPRPTRAEASDVANAVLDGADAIMLSAESAIGKYPVEAARAAHDIALAAEERGTVTFRDRRGAPASTEAQAVAQAANSIASSGACAAIACYTRSGFSAALLSATRPPVPVYAFSSSSVVLRRLALRRGVIPIRSPEPADTDAMIAMVAGALQSIASVQPGSMVVVVGSAGQGPVATNFLHVHRVGGASTSARATGSWTIPPAG